MPRSQTLTEVFSDPRSKAPTGLGISVLNHPSCKYIRIGSEDFDVVDDMNISVGSKMLRRGAYGGEVMGAYSHDRKQLMALKAVNKKSLRKSQLPLLRREIMVLYELSNSHRYILNAHNIVETKQNVFFLMDIGANGNLARYLDWRLRLHEHEARHLFSQIRESMEFLHCIGMAHRDLKCESIQLDQNMNIKIADFGLATELDGTTDQEGRKAIRNDVWRMGTVLMAMLCSRQLAQEYEDYRIAKMIQRRQVHVHFPSAIPVTSVAKNLILRVLQKNIITCDEINQHQWMTCGISGIPAQPPTTFTKNNLGIQ